MKWALFWKGLVIFALSLLLLIPLVMIQGQVSSRQQRQLEVETDIAMSAAGQQQLTGPLLVVHYTRKGVEDLKDEKTGRITRRTWEAEHTELVVPRELSITGDVGVEERYRGLYKSRLFHLNAKLVGRFHLPLFLGLDMKNGDITFGKAQLLLGITDVRGIEKSPRLLMEGVAYDFTAGTQKDLLASSIQADLGLLEVSRERELAFEIPLNLMGSRDLSIAPVADDTRVSLRSNWASPSFGGRFLPVEHDISEHGFTASWQVSHLARNLDRILQAKGEGFSEEAFQVTFIEPVNVYLMSERAVKYGFLFIGLTFAAFFLLEILKRLPIHPVQYLLVGLALGMFFLLLVSLSEHIRFLWAYLAAAASADLLLGVYLSHILGSRWRGLGFAASIALLYGVLYGLLISEDNALLMGSLLLFGILGTIMMVTRKLDWYDLGSSRTPPRVPVPPGA